MTDRIVHEPSRLVYDLPLVTRKLGDSKARKVFEPAIERFEHLLRRSEDLKIPIYCEAARADLAAAGYSMPDEQFRAAFLLTPFDEFARGEVQRTVGAFLYRELNAAVDPEIKRMRAGVIAAFEKTLAKLEGAENEALALFVGQPCEPALASQALRQVLKVLHEQQSTPTDLSWHYKPRMALNGWFPADQPLAELTN